MLVYEVVGEREGLVLAGKENRVHGKALAKLHVAEGVADNDASAEVYAREVFAGLVGHACIGLSVVVVIGDIHPVDAATGVCYGICHVFANLLKGVYGHDAAAYSALVTYHYNGTEDLAEMLKGLEGSVAKGEFLPVGDIRTYALYVNYPIPIEEQGPAFIYL